MNPPILCVEDDPDIGKLLLSLLEGAGFAAAWVGSGEQALSRWQDAALLLLDLSLPGIDGLEVCRSIRARDAAVPIIMLTARAATGEVVRGLELGADDYITKPFDPDILLARVQALLRRRALAQPQAAVAGDQPPLVCGELCVDIEHHQATLAGKPLALTAKEFALLALFASNPGHGFSRSELLDRVWGPDFDGYDHTVNTHINRLRGKVEADPGQPRYIHTVWGVGYRFADAAASGDDA